ncbi:hypothetical protein QJS10_CPA07g00384 [Acorus calamus]|uniref:2-oxoadipate dioxygenase/decarboxylase n=1 Tax=Acorus calamus TaxID=4465 RepID=A0AAV9EHL9_ACOCL|nr:hypothetical protein QJS10_CPA07g00384 [Acorus calamus]
MSLDGYRFHSEEHRWLRSVDCGMFVLKYAEHLIKGTNMDFAQKNMTRFREEYAVKIINRARERSSVKDFVRFFNFFKVAESFFRTVLSSMEKEVIRKYTNTSGSGNKHAALASALGSLTWEKPLYSDYQQLSRESEYAAWTLVNGYALNHVTISTHRLNSHIKDIKIFNRFIEDNGFKLNSEGGNLKVSPDSLLLQSSTIADSTPFDFADTVTESVPRSYIEFAERLVLPQYKNIAEEKVEEFHRREGFEDLMKVQNKLVSQSPQQSYPTGLLTTLDSNLAVCKARF